MIIWCLESPPPERDADIIYTWNGHRETENIHSLLRYVEINSDRLRSKYLSWIHDLGKFSINNRHLIDHLALRNDLSMWWMTPLVEKLVYRSPIADAIRILAIEEILRRDAPPRVLFLGGTSAVMETIRRLCGQLGIEFEAPESPKPNLGDLSLGGIYQRLPRRLQALASLIRHLVKSWPLRHSPSARSFPGGEKTAFFCSFFFNLAPEQARLGHYASRYWTGLAEVLRNEGLQSNWLEIYVENEDFPGTRNAVDLVRKFNEASSTEGRHALVQGYLSASGVIRVVMTWIRLQFIASKLQNIQPAFIPCGSSVSFWLLFREEWTNSLYGPAAINALLWSELFDAALKDIPAQSQGYYLCENQPWERAFLVAWRRHGHGRIVAVPHSTIRYWDLRYFADPRTLADRSSLSLPQPDFYAVNGNDAREALLHCGFHPETLLECEALRYGYLATISEVRGGKSRGVCDPLRVIVLGDYLEAATRALIQLVGEAAQKLDQPAEITVKPHPLCIFRVSDFPELQPKITNAPLKEILPEFDVACATNITSAAVDAWIAGMPVVVLKDDHGLDFSPLRGQSSVQFISSVDDMIRALAFVRIEVAVSVPRRSFFYFDAGYRRWRQLLAGANDVSNSDMRSDC